jgi:anti-anti-sigma regulatory factor
METRISATTSTYGAVLTLGGEFDMSVASRLLQELRATCQSDPMSLLIDASSVDLLDMVCAGLLIGACARQRAFGRHFDLVDVPPARRKGSRPRRRARRAHTRAHAPGLTGRKTRPLTLAVKDGGDPCNRPGAGGGATGRR